MRLAVDRQPGAAAGARRASSQRQGQGHRGRYRDTGLVHRRQDRTLWRWSRLSVKAGVLCDRSLSDDGRSLERARLVAMTAARTERQAVRRCTHRFYSISPAQSRLIRATFTRSNGWNRRCEGAAGSRSPPPNLLFSRDSCQPRGFPSGRAPVGKH